MNMTPILTFGCGLSQNRYGSWIKNSVNRSQKLCERKAYGPSHIHSIQRAPRDTMKCSLSQLEKQIDRYGSQHMQLPLGFQALKTRCKVTVVEAYFPLEPEDTSRGDGHLSIFIGAYKRTQGAH